MCRAFGSSPTHRRRGTGVLRVLLMAGEPVPRTITASTLAIATGAPLAWLRLVSGRSELMACPTQFRIPHLERTYGESREAWLSAARKFVPSGYRAAYEFLGTWAIAID